MATMGTERMTEHIWFVLEESPEPTAWGEVTDELVERVLARLGLTDRDIGDVNDQELAEWIVKTATEFVGGRPTH